MPTSAVGVGTRMCCWATRTTVVSTATMVMARIAATLVQVGIVSPPERRSRSPFHGVILDPICSGGHRVERCCGDLGTAPRGPRDGLQGERGLGSSSRQRSRSWSRRSASSPATYAPAGPTPLGVRLPPLLEARVLAAMRRSRTARRRRSRPSRRARQGGRGARPASRDSSAAAGSSWRAASQNTLSGPRPPAWSQTHAATTPPGSGHAPHLAKPRDGIRS